MVLGWSVDLGNRKRARELQNRRRRLLGVGPTSGEGTFIGHPKDDKVGKILVTGGRGSWRRDRRRRLQPDGTQ